MQSSWTETLLALTALNDADAVSCQLGEMLEAGLRLDDTLEEAWMTPLIVVVYSLEIGTGIVLSEMLRRRANPNIQREPTGETPLMIASDNNRLAFMQLLLDGGASTETEDKEGKTALHRAAFNLNLQAISLLLGYGANRSHRDHVGNDAIDQARAGGDFARSSLPTPPETSIAAQVAEVIALLEDTES